MNWSWTTALVIAAFLLLSLLIAGLFVISDARERGWRSPMGFKCLGYLAAFDWVTTAVAYLFLTLVVGGSWHLLSTYASVPPRSESGRLATALMSAVTTGVLGLASFARPKSDKTGVRLGKLRAQLLNDLENHSAYFQTRDHIERVLPAMKKLGKEWVRRHAVHFARNNKNRMREQRMKSLANRWDEDAMLTIAADICAAEGHRTLDAWVKEAEKRPV